MNSLIAIVLAGIAIGLVSKFLKGTIKTILLFVVIGALYYYLSKYGYIGVLYGYMRQLLMTVR